MPTIMIQGPPSWNHMTAPPVVRSAPMVPTIGHGLGSTMW
jgi:hypothetical protein